MWVDHFDSVILKVARKFKKCGYHWATGYCLHAINACLDFVMGTYTAIHCKSEAMTVQNTDRATGSEKWSQSSSALNLQIF